MSQTEGRIILALQAYQQGRFSSLWAATRLYDVSHTTLLQHNYRTTSRSDFTSPNQKLTQTKEATLVKWILSLDIHGTPPTQVLIHQLAKLLLRECVQNASIK